MSNFIETIKSIHTKTNLCDYVVSVNLRTQWHLLDILHKIDLCSLDISIPKYGLFKPTLISAGD
jgi:hypothetical protein